MHTEQIVKTTRKTAGFLPQPGPRSTLPVAKIKAFTLFWKAGPGWPNRADGWTRLVFQ